MKREIKFRGWNTKDSIMYSAEELGLDQLQIHPNGMGFFNAHPNSTRMSTFFNHITPLQFTGLKDKNGKEIYEGDIVFVDGDWEEFGFMAGETREVYFDNGGFRLKPKDKYSKGHWLEDVGCYVIKGNIYENPELLKD